MRTLDISRLCCVVQSSYDDVVYPWIIMLIRAFQSAIFKLENGSRVVVHNMLYEWMKVRNLINTIGHWHSDI
jgi:hypothetical protein